MQNIAIEVSNLTKKFKDVIAVDNISFSIYPGEIFGLIGPNGAGKTTTVKMLTGLYSPNNGKIKIQNLDIDNDILKIREKIGVMLDEPPLFEYLTTYETLVLYSKTHRIPEGEMNKRIEELLSVFYLTDEKDKLVASLSLGNRKKLSFVSSIIHNPEVLFIDEPLINIDALTITIVKQTIQKFAERGGTVFLTSHILPLVEELCDRIAIMQGGKIIFLGKISELRDKLKAGVEESLEKIFLKVLNIEEKKEFLKWIK